MKISKKYDKEFFWVCFKIGLGVLAYRGALEIFTSVAVFIAIIPQMFASDATSLINVIGQLATAAASVCAFATGAVVLFVSLKIGKHRNYQKIHRRIKLPWTAPFMVMAVVGINFVVAELNAYIMSYISADSITNMAMPSNVGISLAEILAFILSTAVIPALCEEFAFRGLILTNLEPYGKGTAIFGSALLFGLMHMNPAQFLYTTVMGLMLGLVYVKTRSIWLCVIIHFVNNGIAVVQQIMYYMFDMDRATRYSSLLTLFVIALGCISLLILVFAHNINKKRSPAEIGSFGRICDADLGFAAHPVTKSRKVLLFFSSTISIFTLIVFCMMAFTALVYVISFVIPPVSI